MILNTEMVWTMLLEASQLAQKGSPLKKGNWVFVENQFVQGDTRHVASIDVDDIGWRCCHPDQWDRSSIQLIDIYSPFCSEQSQNMIVAHIAQTITGYIATKSGESKYITGKEDQKHNHRLRALFDAVLIGANTALSDNPELTTRMVSGPNPVRIVMDPSRRLPTSLKLFSDEKSPTLLLCRESAVCDNLKHGNADVVGIPASQVASDGTIKAASIAAILLERGLRRIFIEGGGHTIASFLDGGLIDRLHVAVAPMLIGDGRQAWPINETLSLADGIKPKCRRYFLGEDVLFDFDMR